MVHVLKVFLETVANEGVEIRRLAVSSDTVSSFGLLCEKIVSFFPIMNGKTFTLGWKDSEGDFIVMSSDEELAQAVANGEDGLIKVFVKLHLENTSQGTSTQNNEEEVHPNVVCDGCNLKVQGSRYKCLECKDFDLCSNCNTLKKHPNHDMLKLVTPIHRHHAWGFLGSRKIWRSMFGNRAPNFHKGGCDRQSPEKGFAEKQEKTTPNEEDKLFGFGRFLNGDCADLAKLLQENIGRVVKDFADVECHFDKCPCEPGTHPGKQETKPNEEKLAESSSPPQQEANKNVETGIPAAKEEGMQTEDKASPVKPKTGAKPKVISETISAAPEQNDDKEKSPAYEGGLFNSAMYADGWTLLNPLKEDNGKTSPIPLPDKVETVQEKKEFSPNIPAKASTETKPDSKDEQLSKDPKVANALIKMHAMGFTNEGGWLERLLHTKNGNINEALDALYPNTQRR